MAGQNPDSNSADLFDAYFRKADLDGDGQISGAEAVAFFQGSNLPKSILAQVWSYADQKRLGYLGRQEFYNALKLVTVAQSKRELTPDIVKAALYSGASAKIPAPQINLAAMPTLQSKTVTSVPQSSGTTPSPAQALGAQGANGLGNASSNLQFQAPPNQLVRPQFQAQPNQLVRPQFQAQPNQLVRPQSQAQPNQLVRPAQTMPAIASSQPQLPAGQVMPGGGSMPASQPPTSNASTNRLSRNIDGTAVNRAMASAPNQDGFGMTGLHLTPNVQPSPQAIPGHAPVVASKPQDSSLPSNQLSTSNSKELAISGNGFASDSLFGDVFSATPAKQSTTSSAASPIVPTSTVPTSGPHQPATPNSSEALAGSLLQQPLGGQHQQHQLSGMQNKQVTGQSTVAAFTTGAPNQQASVQSVASATSTGLPVGAGSVVSSQSTQIQASWPKMTPTDVQKYTKVFLQVDTDRDGKITGEQARNLFLSWRLPREVLKQVWDLSDQDNDSMLSLREFCTALYLMERYREGRPLPSALPSPIMPDQMPPPFSGQPTAPLSGSWRPAHGYPQPQVMNVARPPLPSARNRPPRPSFVSQADADVQPTRSKLKVPELEKNLIDQLSQEEQDSLNAKFKEATEANKKVEELEKEIEDSRAKIEGYRARMQELVVYKSRCDNRLNEITERVIADKREAEGLAKKYEEKYRQAGDVASRLTIEEATFRDIQENKMELYQALVKIEQGDNAKEAFQERANHIQSGLEELVKTLNERCKQYGLRSKPTTLLELPFGWQSGIQGGAADWSEDWDKFEDEGFTFVKELTLDVQNVIASPKPKSSFVQKEAPSEDVSTKPSSPSALPKLEKDSSSGKQKQEKEMENEQSENLAKSPSSPARSVALGNQSQDFPNSPVESSGLPDGSPNAKESSNQGGAESVLSGGKNFDEPGWGTFDTHYDAESVWGFDKENDHERRESTSLFGLGEFNIKPIRIQSSQADMFQGNSSSIFDSSVPSTPAYPDNLFQGRSSSIFDSSVPSTPAYADDGFKGRSSSLFADSVPSTPAYADNMFNGKVGSAFADSVPSTPAYSDNAFGGRNSSFFSDSVPSTPAYNFGNSDSFSSFSRFDSLRMNDGGPVQSPSLARFDSVRSTTNSEQGYGFPPLRFDSFNARDGNDSGSFQSPRSLARFDSMHSTTYSDHGHEFPSFDDADPFGSTGPFKSTMGSQTPRRDSDHWNAF